ncbi:hypothetical protein [Polynucleobacter sp. es-EL-1]|uniref:hypothetical protein n=1 Tax=Polynucleobacter sp. es-EL-1 TaxID=1855652 RepID=UPI001BFD7754|nr:hypothetical protein [Polynucleobacter sp. es-EL-1]QWE09982.1 hypothetical protein FD974_06410 [Polynucleobacter sp. es-EL-1]
MKTKLLISALSLIATSAYAQPSMPAGASPSANRPEVSRQATPSMPQPAMQRPAPQPAVGATGGTGGNGGNGGLIMGNGGNGATPKPSVTMYNGVGPLPANVVRAPTPVGASQSATQAQVEAVVQDRKAQAQSNAQYRKSDAQTNAQEKLAPYYTGDVDVPSWSGYPPSHPALGGKLEEVIYVAAPVTPTTVGATGVRTPTPPMPADDAKGPTSVGATGVTTPMPPSPANNVKGPNSVGVDIDYNDMVMRLVPHI